MAGLNILSVALGVSVFVSIQIANRSANQSFAASIDMVAGKANLEVRSPSGAVDETLFSKLLSLPGIRAVTPVIEGYVTLPDFPGEYLQVLGVDIFTNMPFATFAIADQSAINSTSLDLEAWLGSKHGVAISDEFARQHGLRIGDVLRVKADERTQSLPVNFILRLADTAAGRGNSRIAALDIGWAQELFQQPGQVSSLQILLDDPQHPEIVEGKLQKILPPDVSAAPPAQRSRQIERMLASFQLNLDALSLISLLVGMFLIYNTIAASVVRRRLETGILRATGATRRQIHLLFLSEAVIFGIIGICLGIVGGVLLARFLVGRELTRVVSTLYLLTDATRFTPSPALIGVTFIFGVGSVVAAAWWPAYEGARANPVFALSPSLGSTVEKSRLQSWRWLGIGLANIFAAIVCAVSCLTVGPAWLGFGSAFFILTGFAFATPIFVDRSIAPVERVLSAMIIARLALQNLRRSLYRSAVVVAALMAAVAMTVGISTMIHAFRQTVEVWINHAIVADIFITPAANEVLGNRAYLPADALQIVRELPGVRSIDTVRETSVSFQRDQASLLVLEGQQPDHLVYMEGQPETVAASFRQPDHVLISEPFARRYHAKTGDRLPLSTPDGIVHCVVAGTYYDYARDSGIIAMSRENYARHWHDDRVTSAAIYLDDDSRLEPVLSLLRERLSSKGEYLIFSNTTLRERVFEVFGQTFRITGVLRGIAVVVAVIGIFLTLTTLISEREREIGVLRALGSSREQIRNLILVESGLLGFLSSILGILAGLALAVALVFVINKAFFGWTIQFSIPWTYVLFIPIWITIASLIAGWLPALRAGNLPIANATRAD